MCANNIRFTKVCCENISESFKRISESFAKHSIIYVIPAYDFRLETSFRNIENAGNINIWQLSCILSNA